MNVENNKNITVKEYACNKIKTGICASQVAKSYRILTWMLKRQYKK